MESAGPALWLLPAERLTWRARMPRRVWAWATPMAGGDTGGPALVTRDACRERVVDNELTELAERHWSSSCRGSECLRQERDRGPEGSHDAPTRRRPDGQERATVAPDLLLDNPSPALFDEWQIVPTPWDQIRRAVDDRSPRKGQYVLTGSTNPGENVNRHSGAGRIAVIQMRPMSLMESGHSTGQVSLKAVLAGDKVAAQDSGVTFADLTDRVCIGGWAALLDTAVQDARRCLYDYFTRSPWSISQPSAYAAVTPRRCRASSRAGRNVGTAAGASRWPRIGGAGGPVAGATIDGYLDSLSLPLLIETRQPGRHTCARPSLSPHPSDTSSTPHSRLQHSVRDAPAFRWIPTPPAPSSTTSPYATSA
jgi:hypothetical protein